MNPAVPGKRPESQAANPMTHADTMTLKMMATILSTRYLSRNRLPHKIFPVWSKDTSSLAVSKNPKFLMGKNL